VGKKEEMKHSL